MKKYLPILLLIIAPTISRANSRVEDSIMGGGLEHLAPVSSGMYHLLEHADEYGSRLSTLEANVTTLRSELNDLRSALAELRSGIESLRAEQAKTTEAIGMLPERISQGLAAEMKKHPPIASLSPQQTFKPAFAQQSEPTLPRPATNVPSTPAPPIIVPVSNVSCYTSNWGTICGCRRCTRRHR